MFVKLLQDVAPLAKGVGAERFCQQQLVHGAKGFLEFALIHQAQNQQGKNFFVALGHVAGIAKTLFRLSMAAFRHEALAKSHDAIDIVGKNLQRLFQAPDRF